MSGIVLRGNRYSGNTIVSNCFIDNYMSEANGAQLKIYLYLMRCIEADDPVSVSSIADKFNYTETDIVRSLMYWAKKGIVTLEFDDERNVSGIILNDPTEACETEVTIPKKPVAKKKHPTYTAADLKEFGARTEIKQLIFVAEQYLSKPLSPSDMKSMLFIYDELGFSTDLIEFLIEYCVCKGKTSTRYIEQTAMNWKDAGIKSVIDAKQHIKSFGSNDYFAVLKAFGITDRKPVESEINFIDCWKDEYGFSMDMILEAVARTMKAIARPSFPYADSILKRWSENDVRSLEEVERLDDVHAKRVSNIASRENSAVRGKKGGNRFNNFDERDYDFDEIEAELLKKRM
ncbi:MAG: DnaD domain protein [Lachnospiraceae bacterium]|nr:DnaD domain protein [Lachnospiraceae bacterium]